MQDNALLRFFGVRSDEENEDERAFTPWKLRPRRWW